MSKKSVEGYDIIGDVHGFHGDLEKLFEKLGYIYTDSVWQHPKRCAVFVGDFICRGPNSRAALSAIRGMVKNKHAYAVLGNHELNAILYFTKSKGNPIHEPSKTSRQLLIRMASEYIRDDEKLEDDIKWLRTLPFYLDFGNFRVAHAYWNSNHLVYLNEIYEDGKIKKRLLKEIASRKTALAEAVTETVRGIELTLPGDLILKDSKNVTRNSFRIKWWQAMRGKTFGEMSFGNRFVLPEYTIPDQIVKDYTIYGTDEPILFVGHYCMSHKLIQTGNICCVDGCIASGGRLAAYRYDGEKQLTEDKLVFA